MGDFDLARARPERGERVDDPLRAVRGRHAGRGIVAAQAIGLVVDDEHPSATLPGEDVERPGHQHVAEQERESLLAPDLVGARRDGRTARSRRTPRSVRRVPRPPRRSGRRIPAREHRPDRGGHRPAEVKPLEHRVDEVPALGPGEPGAARRPAAPAARHARARGGRPADRRQPEHTLGVEPIAAAGVLAERGVRQPRDRRSRVRGRPEPVGRRRWRRRRRGGAPPRARRATSSVGPRCSSPGRTSVSATPPSEVPPAPRLHPLGDVGHERRPDPPDRPRRRRCSASSRTSPRRSGSAARRPASSPRRTAAAPPRARAPWPPRRARRRRAPAPCAPSRARRVAARGARRGRPGCSSPRSIGPRPRSATQTIGNSSPLARWIVIRRTASSASPSTGASLSRLSPAPPSPAPRAWTSSRNPRRSGPAAVSCSRPRRISLRTLASRRAPPGIASIVRS